MNGFCGTDRRKVTVALIGKDKLVRIGTLCTGSHCRSSAVGSFDHIAAEIVIGHYRTAYRNNADGVALDAHFVNDFADQTVYDTVTAARTEVCGNVQQGLRMIKYNSHYSAPPASFSISASTSAGVGITPPVLPKNDTGRRHSVARRTSSII